MIPSTEEYSVPLFKKKRRGIKRVTFLFKKVKKLD
jgi:hypothetical protein